MYVASKRIVVATEEKALRMTWFQCLYRDIHIAFLQVDSVYLSMNDMRYIVPRSKRPIVHNLCYPISCFVDPF